MKAAHIEKTSACGKLRKANAARHLLALLFVILPSPLTSQASESTPSGDKDPEGNTGVLKEQVTTGGGYNPRSGNASRSVTDLSVPGAVGVYGLDFTRHWNSSPTGGSASLAGGGWSHSWDWVATYEEEFHEVGRETGNTEPPVLYTMSITIAFPDGHPMTYKITRYSEWVNHHPPPPKALGPPYTEAERENFLGPNASIGDRLINMAELGGDFWIERRDGGSVHFVSVGSQTSYEGGTQHEVHQYKVKEIFDPYGLRTSIDWNAGAHGLEVEQEGGRGLFIHYDYLNGNPRYIDWVQGGSADRLGIPNSPGTQTVHYGYEPVSFLNSAGNTISYLYLTSVTYPDEPRIGQTAIAHYVYGMCADGTDPNSGCSLLNEYPMLKSADDPHYEGAMTKIRYNYRGIACYPDSPLQGPTPAPPYPSAQQDYFDAPANAIKEEKSADGVLVSSFSINCRSGVRVEQNGLGGWRKFYYGHILGEQQGYSASGYQLVKLTDFTTSPLYHTNVDIPDGLSFMRQNYEKEQPHEVWDGRNIKTERIVNLGDLSGEPSEIRYTNPPNGAISSHKWDRLNSTGSESADTNRIHNSGKWVFSETDENGNVTKYTRDIRRRVKEILYLNNVGAVIASESFTYHDVTNQVTSHTLPSGAIEYKSYYPFGHQWQYLLQEEWNTVDRYEARKEYTYDELGRVKTMLDGRGRVNNKSFTVRMTYNGRHKVIKVEYTDPLPSAAPTPHPAAPSPSPKPTPDDGNQMDPWGPPPDSGS